MAYHGSDYEDEEMPGRMGPDERRRMRRAMRSPDQKARAAESGEPEQQEEREDTGEKRTGQRKSETYDSEQRERPGKHVEHGFTIPEREHPQLRGMRPGDKAVIEAELLAAIELRGEDRQLAFKVTEVRSG